MIRTVILLLVCARLLTGADASHLLIPPPPVSGTEPTAQDNPEASSAATDRSVEQMEKERQKREMIEQGPPSEEKEQEKGLDQLMKNPKFRLNIPF